MNAINRETRRGRAYRLTYKGKQYNLTQLAKELRVCRQTLSWRLYKCNGDLEAAIAMRGSRPGRCRENIPYEAWGRRAPCAEWAKAIGISPRTLAGTRLRFIREGYEPEEALQKAIERHWRKRST